jgi:hypothetical protein
VPGKFVNLFDPELRVQRDITISPASRMFLLDLNEAPKRNGSILASACKVFPRGSNYVVEGIINTPGLILMRADSQPKAAFLEGEPIADFQYSRDEKLLWLRFQNTASPRELTLTF